MKSALPRHSLMRWIAVCAFGALLCTGCTQSGNNNPGSKETKGSGESAEKGSPAKPVAPEQASPAAKKTPAAPAAGAPEGPHPGLLDPSKAAEKAPEKFKVKLVTTQGDVLIEVTRSWSPHGADRFYNLVKIGYFTDVAFFRVLKGFMAQFGIHGDPKVNAVWHRANVPDDPVLQSNLEGFVSFATSGPNSRSTQLFINYGNNNRLDGMGFSPIGRVVEGMDAVRSLYGGYGEGAPRGRGPSQGLMQSRGNAYLRSSFPKLDYIRSASIVP